MPQPYLGPRLMAGAPIRPRFSPTALCRNHAAPQVSPSGRDNQHRITAFGSALKMSIHRTVETGTAAAFFSDEDGRDIQQCLIDYVANFVTVAAGRQFNPPVTIGVGAETYLNQMLADPFASFTFSAAGASVYQLGSFGSARKELRALRLTR